MKNNILTIDEILPIRKKLGEENKKVVFTNGCFDILHAGHVDYLNKAKSLGSILIVGLNSDKSMKSIKGNKRPIVPQTERAFILANLKAVDYVVIFEEDTPYQLIKNIVPDVLVKGADWAKENIAGKEIVENAGGKVETIEFVNFQSTSNIINTILDKFKE